MAIAPATEGGVAAEQDETSIRVPGVAIAGLIAAGLIALVRIRERASVVRREEVPHSLREDVGLPARERVRDCWEWR